VVCVDASRKSDRASARKLPRHYAQFDYGLVSVSESVLTRGKYLA
jgi:hypothetical protein